MEIYLFSHSENPARHRILWLGEEWHETFVVEFVHGAKCFDRLYWGNRIYVEEDRLVISEMLTIWFLPDSRDEWKKENFDKMSIGKDFNSILQQAKDEISRRDNV